MKSMLFSALVIFALASTGCAIQNGLGGQGGGECSALSGDCGCGCPPGLDAPERKLLRRFGDNTGMGLRVNAKGSACNQGRTTDCSLAWAVTAQLHQQLRLVVAVAMVATHLFQCQMVVAAVAIVATHLFQCQMVALSVAAWVQLLVADAVANSVADWVVVALAIANLVASSEVLLADADLVLPLADLVLLVLLVAADSKAVASVVKDAAVAWHVWRAVASVLTTHIHTAEQSHTPHKHQETVQASHLLTLTRTTRLADLATS